MWEARAKYADGSEIEQFFCEDPDKNENEQQYDIECWLLERYPGCTWYSVNWISE